MNKDLTILAVLFIIIFTFNYSFLDSLLIDFLDSEQGVLIDRVIDGDTVVYNGTSIRLLGINAPERGERYSSEATELLKTMALNKSIVIKSTGKDRYYRELAYLFSGSININLELVRLGLSSAYFPSGKDAYYDEFYNAWEECLNLGVNLCERSTEACGECVRLSEWDTKLQSVTLTNTCNQDCDLTGWNIKDEGRKNFIFKNFLLKAKSNVKITVGESKDNDNELFWRNEKYVWTKSGDSIFVRDSSKKLVIWKSY